MAINQLIAAGIQPVRFESPVNMMAQLSQLEAARSANELRQLQMTQLMRQQEQENALAGMPYADLTANPERALRYGAPGRQMYGELLKGARERRQAEQAQRESELKALGTLRFALADVNDQPSYDRWRGLVGQLAPSLKDAVKPEYDPEVVKRYGVEADKRLEAFSPKPTQMRLGDRVVTIDMNPNSPTYNQEIRTETMGAEPLAPAVAALRGAQTGLAQAQTAVAQAELGGTLPARPGAPPELTRLIAERDKLPPGDPNRAAYDARIEALGTPAGTRIEMPQENEFQKKLGAVKGSTIETGLKAAEDARSIIQTIGIGKSILDQGANTGFGANFLVNVGQALKQAGVDLNADASANAQTYMATMAQNVGRIIKQFGAGTGLSNADREYAEKMAGGNITLDERALRRILQINDQLSRNVISKHNENVRKFNAGEEFLVQEPTRQNVFELNPQDKAALDWARAHKDDPRANQILERLRQKGFRDGSL